MDDEAHWEPELTTELVVERHRPERSFDPAVAAGICCSCCCCCCCCAHSVGAAAGAVAGNVGALAKVSGDPDARRGALWAIGVYWAGAGLATLVGLALALVADETLIGLIFLAIIAPAVQLAGSFVALPVIFLQPTPGRRRAAARAVGATTAGWFLGGTVGGVLIALLLVVILFFAGALS